MDRVYQSNAIETPPSAVASSGSYPTAGNKASGQLATVPGPFWFYSITEEIRNAIVAAGITPDSANVGQLALALGKFLPLTGGKMTGTIVNNTGSDSPVLKNDTGAQFWLFGANDQTYKGGFILRTKKEDGEICDFRGDSDGGLIWGGQEVLNPVGSVIAYAANAAPVGYLLCNGSAVSRSTYAKLFEKIGTTYGEGDGSTTFNLPNLGGKFIQGSATAGTVKNAGLPESRMGNIFTSVSPSASNQIAVSASALGAQGNWYGGDVVKMNITEFKIGSAETVQPPALTMRYYIKY